jgi:hypothetical protein
LKVKDQNKDFQIVEDWSKVIHIGQNKFFVTGGSWQDDSLPIPVHMRSHRYSKKAFIIDINTAEVERLPDMHVSRQAHGMVKVGDYVYCCAGLDGGYEILSTCERYNLQH